MFKTGTSGAADASFLNDLIPGWDTSSVDCSTVTVNDAAAAGTAWAGNGNLGVSPFAAKIFRYRVTYIFNLQINALPAVP